ncbi:MAG: maleylacetoacetate isomerase [Zoogloea sp.]|uniref:maleylacetoacetate isomerase n=1 Tax=Zoogloea sp. TaxID=49181 RepID=UPI003F3FB68B
MKLYSFFASGTSYRTRIALNLKGVDYELLPVNLRVDEGLKSAEYRQLNAMGAVPTLITDQGPLVQSTAIIEWLEETHPEPALLPRNPADRAWVRALASIVACDMHPVNNRRVLQYLQKELGCDQAQLDAWTHRWLKDGLGAMEQMLVNDARKGRFCYGDTPGLADIYLVTQLAGARRFKVDLTPYPTLLAIDAECAQLEAFQKAAPAKQPDFVAG